jgi:hypothetical protein
MRDAPGTSARRSWDIGALEVQVSVSGAATKAAPPEDSAPHSIMGQVSPTRSNASSQADNQGAMKSWIAAAYELLYVAAFIDDEAWGYDS